MQNTNGLSTDAIKTKVQSNYAQADVYFQTMNVVNIVESAYMDVSTITEIFNSNDPILSNKYCVGDCHSNVALTLF